MNQSGENRRPRLVVFSSLFPHAGAPGAGLFIRERMFRVGRELPITVVSPRPWFPGQGLIRRLRPGYRTPAPVHEIQQGVEIYFPRFFALPAIGRRFDGFFMALGARRTLRRLQRTGRLDILDAHFTYPDGYAATRLGHRLGVPVTITLRGTEVPHARRPALRRRLVSAWRSADKLFAVSRSLADHAVALGAPAERIQVVGNGVDIEKFHPIPQAEARRRLGLEEDAGPVLISVGALVERKGFHRVIELLPRLREKWPGIRYLAVGGPSPEGDMSEELRAQVERLGLQDVVRFTGPVPPEELHVPLSAADLFVLATRNEGWANVFLEAMACGLPVVTTDVGGNREVVCNEQLGLVVPYGDAEALHDALAAALERDWDRRAILEYAHANSWDERVAALVEAFRALHRREEERR